MTKLDSLDHAEASPHPSSLPAWLAAIAVLFVITVAAAVQVPALDWLEDVRPETVPSLHPDELRFVVYAERFEDKPSFNYLIAQAAHMYVVKEATRVLWDQTPDLVMVGRLVSLAYALATVALVAIIAWELTASALVSALSAALLALAPLHIVYGQIGVADAMAAFFAYLALYAAARHLRTPATATMVLLAASVGAALAAKFFIPILVPFAAVILFHRTDPLRVALLVLVAGFGFMAGGFFALTPWDFAKFIYRLIFDAAVIIDGHTPLENVVFYGEGIVPALGLGCTALAIWGAWICLRRFGPAAWVAVRGHLADRAYLDLVTQPATVVTATLLLHVALMLTLDFAAIRFMLPLVPALCIVAAIGLADLAQRLRPVPWAGLVLVIIVLGYQGYNAAMLERLIGSDIRQEVVAWLASNLGQDEHAVAFMRYATVRGVHGLPDDEDVLPDKATHLVTCNGEYGRYFRGKDVSEIFHPVGGQPRVDLFHALFAGETEFEEAVSFEARPYGLEQRLMWDRYVGDLAGFIQRRCIVFARNPSAMPEPSG